ncbi:ferrochelatase [Thermomonas sp.]|uniref:ferrochelatase n=1 Tax=Thermomonas sp. TaxID=1971895 RepID=UPI001D765D1C|nr:ferrochelatase [Thermomonas sp.]MBZ0086591.1 ferrochelatase [Thermomonas sp.]HRO62668.1 ferrochelatase [Thermomonas sp.]
MSPSSEVPPALLLANLGTPAAATPAAVSAYLREFLSDPRVVQIPRWLWRPLLRWVILPRRSPKVAHKYASIWLDGGSPLAVHTAALARAVQERLPDREVGYAMRYGAPSLAAALASLRERGVRRVRVLPLYPQYSTTTTASMADAIAMHGAGMRVELLHDYHADPDWAAAIAASIRAFHAEHGRGQRLLLSYHGIPERLVRAGDPYAAQCEASTQAIAHALGVERDALLLTFQSRFGPERWLQPYTLQTLQELARQGVHTVDVVCPGFAADCLETLEEIALQNAEAFRAAGGETLRYIRCLNGSPMHADVLAKLARSDAGWS